MTGQTEARAAVVLNNGVAAGNKRKGFKREGKSLREEENKNTNRWPFNARHSSSCTRPPPSLPRGVTGSALALHLFFAFSLLRGTCGEAETARARTDSAANEVRERRWEGKGGGSASHARCFPLALGFFTTVSGTPLPRVPILLEGRPGPLLLPGWTK